MISAARQKKISPMALVGKIFTILGAVYLVLGAALSVYRLIAWLGNHNAQPGTLLMVLGLISLIFVGLGLLFLLVGLLLWLVAKDSPAGKVVSNYLAAIANQDYTTAFAYVNPNLGVFPGQQFTRETFIQGAQAADAAQGRVIDYALTGVRAVPPQREFMMRVTRESGSYRTRLYLRKQDGEWKISGFDRF